MPEDSDCFTQETQVKFIDMFNGFFTSSTTVSTYKMFFLRSFIDLGRFGEDDLVGKEWVHREGDKIRLDLDFVAVRFARYYWDMEIAFHMRHMPERMADSDDPGQDVLNIVKLIRARSSDMVKQRVMAAMDGMNPDVINDSRKIEKEIRSVLNRPNPPTLEELASPSFESFRQDVIKHAIKPEVLVKILNDMPDLYERVLGQNHILLDSGIVPFLKKFSPMINKALNYILALHLEKYNPSARHIATKIDSETEFESMLEKVKGFEIKIKHKYMKRSKETTDDQKAVNPAPRQ